ncbi:MAG: hypothetical protein H8E37_01385 [Planctomycetes bacterium]|nr:hypothetical protein [Planctomycetota bacterium]
MKSFDPKSMLLGALCAAVLVCIVGAANVTGPATRRYELEVNEKNAFILDTATGRAWQTQVISGSSQTGKNFYDAKSKTTH